MEDIIKNKYELKELELNSLLEVTQAINNNLPEESLYKIYHFTLRANLNIKKLALYVLDDRWDCKANHGTDANFYQIPLEEKFLDIQEITYLESSCENSPFGEFETMIPVMHKNSILAFVFLDGIRKRIGGIEGDVDTTFIQALSNIILVAIENKKLARKELRQEAFKKEMEIAKDVQKYLFPENLPYGPRLKVEASYLPHHTIGGDYYDYIPINRNQFLLCIADVSGKGIPAAILMSNFQASLRTLIRQTSNISTIVEELNYQILENAKGENFITFFAAIYDHKLKTLVYVNAGHNPPLLYDSKNGLRFLDMGTTVLGSFQPLPFLNEGFITDLDDFLFFGYTDGLTELRNNSGEEFGIERLEKLITSNVEKGPREIHQDIMQEIDTFREDTAYSDDITILSCKVDP
ncbi:PP2C family protein-serine/threonine phosphatase [Fulvivirgaceae bacterium BMA10]|uniref:PP2C family protein-serine/threonine phosphatase n=1 Tax=Splendidivirga corallicola TaxID=3051826 RepID=A0ABT8KQ98_9BACT|nr:PP2C family protein-serine/threonine phosphatase [Fulvivirgaceae bacterium BMA10]